MSEITSPDAAHPRITALDVLRFLSEILAFGSLALWGFLAWPLPWSVVFGFGAPIVAIAVWALFLSPKAVFHVHRDVRTVVELLVFASATLALWALDLAWAGIAVGAFCIVVGVLHGRRTVR
ncbi:YrdB family protein [Microbacterium karelineae]|uniref:YrdB family protein n=1 Tax=Microbacterium karelineae TaxID=2654283 RepID=UPI0012E9D2F7|nr:YrdB family protein [Microbacterium karelineae]